MNTNTEVSSAKDEENALHIQLRSILESRGMPLKDDHTNCYRAIPVEEVMRLLLENANDVLGVVAKIHACRFENKYSCIGCTLAGVDWCSVDGECQRNSENDNLPDLYVTN